MNFKFTITIFCLIFSAQFMLAQKSYKALIYEGNKEFDSKNYEASSSKYLEAIAQKNGDYTAHYNLGNALYKSKKYKEADAEYVKAEKYTENRYEKAAALYNRGNVYMKSNEPDKAAELYKKALKQDPYNEAIQENYKTAVRKQEEIKKSAGKKQNNSKKDKNNNQSESKEDKKDPNKKQQDGNDEIEKGKSPGKPNESKQENKIPKEVEKLILKDIENQEKETARKILNKKSNYMPQSNEKDW